MSEVLSSNLRARDSSGFLKFLLFIIIGTIFINQIFDIKMFKNHLFFFKTSYFQSTNQENFVHSLKTFLAIHNNSLFSNGFKHHLFIIEPCLLSYFINETNYCNFNHNLISFGIFSQHLEENLVSY